MSLRSSRLSLTARGVALATLLTLAPHVAHASCADLPGAWFGRTLGPLPNPPPRLPEGIVLEGTGHIVDGVTLESLEGSIAGIKFDRVMVYLDRGDVVGVTAVGSVPHAKHAGLFEIIDTVATASGAKPTVTYGTATFACPGGLRLTVEPTTWTHKALRVKVEVIDPAAQARMQTYVVDYCADPTRRKRGDACR